ncbi:MAG: rhodanese-like domain-containing protein, partial [Bacteroidetes bacterium]
LTPQEFEEMVENTGALMLDTRSPQEFAAGHIPNSIFIGLDGNFAPWVGALIPDLQQPIVVIAPEGREEEAVTRLARVGYDHTLGYLKGGIEAWKAAGKELDRVESIPAAELESRFRQKLDGTLLDVRRPTEFLTQHVVGAVNFPLDYINGNMHRLDRNAKYYIHCAGGYRSMITASILKSRGFHNVVDIQGGWKAIEQTDLPKTEYTCPTTIPQEVLDEAIAQVS